MPLNLRCAVRFAALGIGFLLVTACSSPPTATEPRTGMEGWIGVPVSALVSRMGPPAHEESDGKGGKILSYHKFLDPRVPPQFLGQSYSNSYSYSYSPDGTGPGAGSANIPMRQFFVNPQGVIYGWR